MESELHLFWNCQVAKALWFASPWSIRWDFMQSESIISFVDCLWKPEKYLHVLASDKYKFFLFATLILEHLWSVRNDKIHDGKTFDIVTSMQFIQRRFGELLNISALASETDSREVSPLYSAPSQQSFSIVMPPCPILQPTLRG